EFDKNGYLVVEGVLPEDLRREILATARPMIDVEPEVGRRVWHERALFRRPAFRKVLDLPRLIGGAEALIGEDVQLLAMDLLFVRAGHGNVGWHRDIGFVCNKTLSINTGIYLQDLTEESGPLRVVPGTHRVEEHPPQCDELPGMVKVVAPAGAAVFFDAGL
ncbi:MAG: hypothetical protein C4321_05585, partial [Chloroflexota bacterium]